MEMNEEWMKTINEAEVLEGLKILSEKFPSGICFSTSLGQEDQVITDIIFNNNLPIEVFTIDTGRLFPEHYSLLSQNNAKYKKDTKVYFPEAKDVEQYVSEKGINGFYNSKENRLQCCHVRKVLPLNRALEGKKVWITGLRNEQSSNRGNMPKISWDQGKQLYKYNPLLNWSYEDVVHYLKENGVQELPLHKKGYISVGCQPCTRAIVEGENPRDGRWWWEESHKECGLHLDNSNA